MAERGISTIPPAARSVSLRPMAIVTKRNAVVGWITLKFGRRVGVIFVHDQKNKLTRKLSFRSKR